MRREWRGSSAMVWVLGWCVPELRDLSQRLRAGKGSLIWMGRLPWPAWNLWLGNTECSFERIMRDDQKGGISLPSEEARIDRVRQSFRFWLEEVDRWRLHGLEEADWTEEERARWKRGLHRIVIGFAKITFFLSRMYCWFQRKMGVWRRWFGLKRAVQAIDRSTKFR